LYYIGVDLSVASTGVAVIDEEGYIVETMAIKTTIDNFRGQGEFSDRMAFITDNIMSVLKEYRPAKLAIESMPFSTQGYGILDRARLLGVLEYRISTEVPEHKAATYIAPKSLKKKVTGSGNADKKDMKASIDALFGYDLGLSTDDEVDALGLALCVGEWF